MKVNDVQVTKVEPNGDNELSDTFFRVCVFCDKVVRVDGANFKSCVNLSGNKFYCPFCLRNNFHFRSNRNVLIMSFRAILGYYYSRLYEVVPRKMYYNQMETYLDKHVEIGLNSPVLSFDPETLLWFVDFNRIGNDRHKAPFDEVMHAIGEMYDVFDIDKRVNAYAHNDTWDKFEKAITTFYQKRKRPKGRRMLIPTFAGAIMQEKEEFWDTTRDFVRSEMRLK